MWLKKEPKNVYWERKRVWIEKSLFLKVKLCAFPPLKFKMPKTKKGREKTWKSFENLEKAGCPWYSD